MTTQHQPARRRAAWLLPLLLLAPTLAVAAGPGDYKPYTPPEAGAGVSAPLFVLIAYSAIWIVLLLFIALVWRRQRRVEEEIAALRGRLGGGSGPRPR